jgi:hypothetical protein
MVLKAPDYGFIGLKLKDLIFQELDRREHAGRMNIHWFKKRVTEMSLAL